MHLGWPDSPFHASHMRIVQYCHLLEDKGNLKLFALYAHGSRCVHAVSGWVYLEVCTDVCDAELPRWWGRTPWWRPWWTAVPKSPPTWSEGGHGLKPAHTHTQTYIHTNTHTQYTHTYKPHHTHTHIHKPHHTHTHTHSMIHQRHMNTYTCMHTCIYAHAHMYMHAHKHTHAFMCTYMCTQTIHAMIHTQKHTPRHKHTPKHMHACTDTCMHAHRENHASRVTLGYGHQDECILMKIKQNILYTYLFRWMHAFVCIHTSQGNHTNTQKLTESASQEYGKLQLKLPAGIYMWTIKETHLRHRKCWNFTI